MPRTEIIRLRVTPEEKARWTEAAGGPRKLSELIREAVEEQLAPPEYAQDETHHLRHDTVRVGSVIPSAKKSYQPDPRGK